MQPPSIAEYKALLERSSAKEVKRLLAQMDADPRAGVRSLAAQWSRKLDKQRAERRRLDRLMERQRELRAVGIEVVAGVDEVGRGALAGPLTAAAVVLDADCRIEGLDDSKRLLPERRESVAFEIRQRARAWAVAHVEPAEIDAVGIGEAVMLGMQRAIEALGTPVGHALVDGNIARLSTPATAVVGGDGTCACIAAASVVAKVQRDELMVQLAERYPAYGFAANKGYGTAEHLDAIAAEGVSPIHRRSFGPCVNPRLF